MTHDRHSEEPTGFLARLNPIETVVLAIIALVALAGLMLVGKGLFMKTKTEIAERPASVAVLGAIAA